MLIPYLLMHLNREIYCPLLFYYESAISFSLTYKLYNSFEKKSNHGEVIYANFPLIS